MKKDIIIDFDEVLFSTEEATLYWLENHYNITIPRDGYICGSSLHHLVLQHLPPNSQPIDEYVLYELFGREFLASRKHHQDIQPMEGASDALRILSETHTLHVATARLTLGRDVVKFMLDKFFPEQISSIHHVWHINDKGIFSSSQKKDFIQTLGSPILFIDDSPREICEASDVVETVLFDPQNHHVDVIDSTYRVNSWEEVLNIIQSE